MIDRFDNDIAYRSQQPSCIQFEDSEARYLRDGGIRAPGHRYANGFADGTGIPIERGDHRLQLRHGLDQQGKQIVQATIGGQRCEQSRRRRVDGFDGAVEPSLQQA